MSSLTPKRYTSPGRRVSFSEPLELGPTVKSKDLLSSDTIIDWVNRKPPAETEVKNYLQARERDEKSLIASQPVCPAPAQGAPQKNLNIKNMKDLMNQAFFDPEVMTQAFCNIDGVILSAERGGATRKIRRFLGDMKRIGNPSANGIAMGADLKAPEEMSYGMFDPPHNALIVKTTRDPAEDSSLLHEYVVGVFGLNLLRSWIPNFAFILGAFKCSAPIFQDKEVLTYCEADPRINYVLYETIQGTSMRESIKKMTREEYVCYFYQLALALRLAHLQCDFTHYDLHSENVLLRAVWNRAAYAKAEATGRNENVFDPDKFWIPYPKAGGGILIHTEQIPTIIDYGTSHFRYKDKSFGNPTLVNYGVLSQQSFPMHDIYKFNMSCALAAAEAKNTNVLEACDLIFRFFNKTEDFMTSLSKQVESKTFLFPPPEVGLLAVRHDEFLRYFEDVFSSDLVKFVVPDNTVPTNGLILSCGGTNLCANPRDIERAMVSVTPTNLLDAWENKVPLTIPIFEQLEARNREYFLLGISKTGEAARQLQPTWYTIQNMSANADINGYYQQLLNMTSMLDNAWQVHRYASAGIEKASEVYRDNPSGDSTSSFYRNEYSNFVATFEKFITAIETNFQNDMKWLSTSGTRSELDDKLIAFNNVIDFSNAYNRANNSAMPVLPLLKPIIGRVAVQPTLYTPGSPGRMGLI